MHATLTCIERIFLIPYTDTFICSKVQKERTLFCESLSF